MGPLEGLKIVDVATIGPGPFCGMLLADLGADVIRIDRKDGKGIPAAVDPAKDILARGRRTLALDFKEAGDVGVALSLVEKADVFFEGFRPGVMEKLGLGPEQCMSEWGLTPANPAVQ